MARHRVPAEKCRRRITLSALYADLTGRIERFLVFCGAAQAKICFFD
jgi:hypothetical protein